MKAYAQPIKRLISELGKLPGIGEKTATRLANYILRASADDVKKLAESIIEVKRKIKLCKTCLNLTEGDVCHICHDKTRDHGIICVVEDLTLWRQLKRAAGSGELIMFYTAPWLRLTESDRIICTWASLCVESIVIR